MIEFVALMLSAPAYAFLYAAAPDGRTRMLLAMGTAVLAPAVAFGAAAWGHVTGPTMVATVATAAASVGVKIPE